jgi:hypothetical protein
VAVSAQSATASRRRHAAGGIGSVVAEKPPDHNVRTSPGLPALRPHRSSSPPRQSGPRQPTAGRSPLRRDEVHCPWLAVAALAVTREIPAGDRDERDTSRPAESGIRSDEMTCGWRIMGRHSSRSKAKPQRRPGCGAASRRDGPDDQLVASRDRLEGCGPLSRGAYAGSAAANSQEGKMTWRASR